jgi:hypothetical protein
MVNYRRRTRKGGELNRITMNTLKVNVAKPKSMKNKLKNLGSRATQKLSNLGSNLTTKATLLGYRAKNMYNSTFQRAGDMSNLMASARMLKNKATAKAKNLGQKLKNKYNVTMTSMKLNSEFANRPNTVGMTPGAASRNLLKVANKQQRNMQTRKNNSWSSGNMYQGASALTSIFS